MQTVSNDAVYERETSALNSVKDNYRKILLTQDHGHYNDMELSKSTALTGYWQ